MTVGDLKAKLNNFDDNLPVGYLEYNPYGDDYVLSANNVEFDDKTSKVVLYE